MAYKKVFDYGDVFDEMHYPAGEPHVRLRAEKLEEFKYEWLPPFIVANAADWNDLVTIKIGDQILKDNGITATFVVPYLPFSRHDRKNDRFDSSPLPFVLDLMATVDLVTIDPHSDVSGIFPSYSQAEVVKLYADGPNNNGGIFADDALVAIPDAGAAKKAYTWLDGRDAVQCLKTRDTKTGALSGFQVVNPEIVEGRNVVIIDDICDGGGTFLGLAEQLQRHGASTLRLGVTHGLFTKGLEKLSVWFDSIYTLDTCKFPPSEKLHHMPTELLITTGEYF